MGKKFFTAALMGAACVMSGFAQISLSGKVTDAETGEPVHGAYIRLKGTGIGCATNDRGEFLLKDIPDGKYTMRISRVDYVSETLSVNKGMQDIFVRLNKSAVNLDQVVVTGTGTHHKLKDSPVPVQVISQKEIRQVNAFGIEDVLLKLVPSVSFQSTSMSDNIYMNGLSGEYVLILMNGRKIAGDVSGNVDLSRINIANVKRIEILNGAASALYGSDAVAGVINIIMDEGSDDLSIMSDSRISSHGRLTQSVSADVSISRFTSRTSYQRRQSDGWKLSDYEENDGEPVETDKQPVYRWFSNDVSQSFSCRFTDRFSVNVFGSYSTYENDRSPAVKYDIEHKTYQYGGEMTYLLPESSHIGLGAATTSFRTFQNYTEDSDPYKAGDSMPSKDQDYTNAYLKGVFNLGGRHVLNTGLDYADDALKSTKTSDLGNMRDRSAYTLAFYAQDEIKLIRGLSTVIGFRYVYHETFHSRFNPKVSLMYKAGGLNLRASYASAFKAPTLQQLYAVSESRNKITAGSTSLKPENSNFYNLSAGYDSKYFTVSVSGYINDVRNLIDYKAVDLTDEDKENGITARNQYANIGRAKIKGFDAGFTIYPGSGFSLGAAYNYTRAKDMIAGVPLERSVRHSGTCSLGWNRTWNIYTLNVNLSGRYQGTRWSDTYGPSPAFQSWDLTTRHTIRLKKFTLEPGAGIENIFNYRDDRPYNSHYATTTPGRAFFATLLVRFTQ